MRKLYVALLCLCCLIALNSVLAQEPPPTETPTVTQTPTETATASLTPSETATASATSTFIGTPTATHTETATITPTASATQTATPTSFASPTATGTAFTPTPESTYTPEPLATITALSSGQFPENTPSSPPNIAFVSPNSYLTLDVAVVDPLDAPLLPSIVSSLNARQLNTPFTIYLLEGTYRFNVALNFSEDVAIYGRGVDLTFLERSTTATTNFPLIAVLPGTSFIVDNLTFQNGSHAGFAGALAGYDDANITVTNSRFRNNSATVGGAVWIQEAATVQFENTLFTNNRALQRGAAVGIVDSFDTSTIPVVSMRCVRFQDNLNNPLGVKLGAFFVLDAIVTIMNQSSFINSTNRHILVEGSRTVQAPQTYWATPSVSSMPNFFGVNTLNQLTTDPGACAPLPPQPLPVRSTPTATVTATRTYTPTRVPRTVETQAQPFHDRAAQLGLPAPFTLWPVTGTPDLYQNGYGPNWFASSPFSIDCFPAAPPTALPVPASTPTSTPIPDPCQYRSTNRIHPGVDYYAQGAATTNVLALCDGIIVPGRTAGGGSAAPNAGAGLSLRCFADDPYDPDGDGNRNVSNVVVVYNHLTLATQVRPATPGGPYQIVRAGYIIATTIGYVTNAGQPVAAHLDLQIYIAYGFQASSAIQLNPRLMFAYPRSRVETEQQPYPSPYNIWSLQGRREGFGSVSFWLNQNHPAFIYDAASYLEMNLLPPTSPYIYPNCTNLPANTTDYGIGRTYTECVLDQNDINVTPTPTP